MPSDQLKRLVYRQDQILLLPFPTAPSLARQIDNGVLKLEGARRYDESIQRDREAIQNILKAYLRWPKLEEWQAQITNVTNVTNNVTTIQTTVNQTTADLTALTGELADQGNLITSIQNSVLNLTAVINSLPASVGQPLTRVDDTNVILTLSANAPVALLAATSITVEWAGTMAAARLNSNVVQSVVNDTNVTGSITAQVLTLGWTGQASVARGGTGAATLTGALQGNGTSAITGVSGTQYGLLYWPTSTTIGTTAAGTATTVLHGAVAGVPTWGQIVNADIANTTIDLTAKVTGLLPLANGGTNANLTAVNGGLVYSTATAFAITAALSGIIQGNGAAAPTGIAGTQYGLPYWLTTTTIGTTGAGTSTTVLHGNSAGAPTWSAISLTADVSGDLPFANIAQIANNSLLGNFTGGTADIQVLTSITSANLAQIVSDETGSGLLVFATAPVFTTSISTPLIVTAAGALGITPAAGSGVNVTLSTTGDFAINTTHLTVDTSLARVGVGTASPLGTFSVEKSTDVAWATSGNIQGLVTIGKTADTSLAIGAYSVSDPYIWMQAAAGDSAGVVYDIALQPLGGNVGFGTIAPGSKVDIKGTLRLSGSSSGYIGFAPQSGAGSTTYVWPNSDGTNNYVLTTDGAGNLSWSDKTGGVAGSISSINGDSSAAQTIAAGAGLSLADVGATHTLSLATDIPTATTIGSGYIYRVGGTDVIVADGGTGVSTLALNGILFGNGASAIQATAAAASSVLVTNGSNVPSLSTDIPTAVTIGGAYIYRAGGTDVSVPDGGTGASTLTGMIKGNGASAFTAITGATNRVTFWSDANTISSDAGLTWTGTALVLSGSSGAEQITLANSDTASFTEVRVNNAATSATFVRIFGSTAAGTYFGIARASMSLLATDEVAGPLVVGTFGAANLVFGTNSVERARIGSTGGLSVGSTTTTAGVVNVATGFQIADAALSGRVLRGDGTNFISAVLGSGDITNSTFVTAVTATAPITATAGLTPVISTSMATGSLIGRNTAGTGVMEVITDIPTAITIGGAYVYRVGGTDVIVADGGTGASTLTGMLKGNGASAFTAVTGGTNRVTFWSDANTISSNAVFTFDGTTLGVDNSDATGFTTMRVNNAATSQLIMRIFGATAAGTYFGSNRASMSLLATDEAAGPLVVGTFGAAAIILGTTSLERARIGAGGGLSVGHTSTASGVVNAGVGFQIAGAATAGTILRGDGTNYVATTATYPATTTVSQILYSSATNVVSGLATANSAVMVTNGSGVPSLATDIPTAVTIGSAYIYRVSGTDVAIADGGTAGSTATAGFNNLSPLTTRGDLLTRDATNNVRLGIGTTGKFVRSDGTDASWQSIVVSDIGSGATLTAGTGMTFSSGTGAGAVLVAGTLGINQATAFAWTGLHTFRGATAGTNAIYVEVTGDAETRFQLTAGGRINLSSGAVGYDTSLYRSAVGVLKVENILDVVTGFRIGNAAASGRVLRGDGTNFISAVLAAADIGSGATLTAGTGLTFSSGTGAAAVLVAGTLGINLATNFFWTGQHYWKMAGANSAFILSEVTADAEARFQLLAGGKMWWGPGDAAVDVSLERSALGVLTLTGGIIVSGLTASKILYTDGTKKLTSLAAPGTDGYVLSSTIAGALSWVAPGSVAGANLTPGTGLTISAGSGTAALLVAATLGINQATAFFWTGIHQWTLAGAAAALIYAEVTGDAEARFQLLAGGKMYWGDGTNSVDVSMERTAAGVLTVTGDQNAGSGLKLANSNTGTSAFAYFSAISGAINTTMGAFSNGVYGYVGTVTNHPFQIFTNNLPVAVFSTAGALDVDLGYTVAGAVAVDGTFLRGNGTRFVAGAISASDLPYPTLTSGQVIGAGTLYDLTTTYARVDFGTTDPQVTLPSAGTYVVTAICGFVNNGVTGELNFKFFNSTDAADVASSERKAQSIAVGLAGQIILQNVITVAASKVIQIYAKTPTVGTDIDVIAAETSISYVKIAP